MISSTWGDNHGMSALNSNRPHSSLASYPRPPLPNPSLPPPHLSTAPPTPRLPTPFARLLCPCGPVFASACATLTASHVCVAWSFTTTSNAASLEVGRDEGWVC